MLIDAHAHLDMPEFESDRDEVIRRAHASGVEHIITVGIDIESCNAAIALSERYESVSPVVGIHPHNVKDIDGDTYDILRNLVHRHKVCALGEIGLDFFRNLSPQEIQKVRFREMIELARELELPIVVHDRDAHQETLTILREGKACEVGGVIHCFSGDYEMACECFDMGFYISIPGAVTCQKAHALHEVVKRSPLEHMLIETDCPFLAPVPFRGKRNEPSYVSYVAEKIAQVKKVDCAEVAAVSVRNAQKVFRLGC